MDINQDQTNEGQEEKDDEGEEIDPDNADIPSQFEPTPETTPATSQVLIQLIVKNT